MEPELSARVRLHCHVLNRDGYVWFHRHHPYPLWSLLRIRVMPMKPDVAIAVEIEVT